MGVYSNNRTQLGTYSGEEIAANENYSFQTGLLEMAIDNLKNDQAIFEAVITCDFNEAAGAVMESTEVVQEATGFTEKVKDFVKKCWEKIKSIFKSFMVKINNVIMRDNKEFVNKYKKQVLAKDLSKMKYKWRQPEKSNEVISGDPVITLKGEAEDKYRTIMSSSDNELAKLQEDVEDSEAIDKILSDTLDSGSTTAADFHKDFMDELFKEEDEVEGLSSSRLSEIMIVLTNASTTLKGAKKLETDCDKMYSSLLTEIDRSRTKIMKEIPGKDGNKQATDTLARQNLAYKSIQQIQTAIQKVTGASLDAVKFHIKQCRRVFAQAAAFNPKAVKENAIFVEAAGDAAEYDLMSSFEDYSL